MSIPPAGGSASASTPSDWGRLVDAVQRAFAGTPYIVQATPETITVVADLADARFLSVGGARRFSQVYRTRLTAKGPGRVAWEDAEEVVSWTAGVDGALVPRLTGKISGMRGRVAKVQFRKEVGVDERGLGTPVDFTFSTEEIRRPLKAAVEQAGFRTAMATTTRIGLVFAILGAVGGLAGGIGVLLIALGVVTPQ